jgi:hypothetical protein
MATYQVSGPGGAVYQVEGPDGADPSAIIGTLHGQASAQPSPNAPQGALGELALAGRNVGEGVFDTLMAPRDLGTNFIVNPARRAINSLFGTHLPQSPLYSSQLSQALTASGAPVPTTPGEQLAGSVIRGTAGALTGAGALGMLAGAPALTTLPNVVRAGAAGATGGASSDIARHVGAGPIGQFVAGLAGGLTPMALEGGLSALGAVARPFTRSGQVQLAANTLTREATNPTQAAVNLTNAQPLVPGSMRTAGEASGDTGILSLEKGVRARNPGPFGERISQQNAARQAELANLGGTQADIAAAERLRDAQTGPMRDAAFAAARQARAAAGSEAASTDALPVLGKRNFQTSDPTQDSIIQWLAKHSRGIDSVEARAQGIDPADFGAQAAKMGIKRAFRNGGMSFDEAAEALHQAGYPVADEFGNYSPNALLDSIDSELRGRPVYSIANTRRFAELEHEMAAPPNGETPEPPPTITTPVHQTISRILTSPAGARESIGKTMRWAQGLIGDHTDPEALYEVRKDLALAQQDRLQPSGRDAPNATMLAQARGQLGQVIKSLDDAIESAAPGYKAYLSRYAELSEPIDQMGTIQGLQQKASSGLDTATGEPFLSAPQFSRSLQNELGRAGPAATRFTPDQVRRLQAVREDLQRGNALSSPTVRTPGSDTFQNFMTGRRLGGGLVGHVPWLGKYLRGVNDFVDQRVNEQLANAMLDPQYAASLLRRGVPFAPFRARLTGAIGRGALPATVGPLAALPPPSPSTPLIPALAAPPVQARGALTPAQWAQLVTNPHATVTDEHRVHALHQAQVAAVHPGAVVVKEGPGKWSTILPAPGGGVPQRFPGLLGIAQ